MNQRQKRFIAINTMAFLWFFCFSPLPSKAQDIEDIKKKGVLRHLGVLKFNYVQSRDRGLEVELLRLFADKIGVKYEYVPSSADALVGDLVGKGYHSAEGKKLPIRGDVIACGYQSRPWRLKMMDLSEPTFFAQELLFARADDPIAPVVPTGDPLEDVRQTLKLLNGKTVLLSNSFTAEYNSLDRYGAKVIERDDGVVSFVPKFINKELSGDFICVGAAEALIVLNRWPGRLRVIGPLSRRFTIGAWFRKDSPQLREAFNKFIDECRADGTYMRLIRKYYPEAPFLFPGFFHDAKDD